MQVVYFVNSGSEANELAMLMARLYSNNPGIISLRNAYHGGSSSTIGLTALNTWKYKLPEVCTPLYSFREKKKKERATFDQLILGIYSKSM